MPSPLHVRIYNELVEAGWLDDHGDAHVCVPPDVGSVEGLAYHRAWDTLYWTSSTTSSITRHSVDQSRPGSFSREAVVTLSEDDHPHVLALNECQKYVVLVLLSFPITWSCQLPWSLSQHRSWQDSTTTSGTRLVFLIVCC
jgi:hypothetical protein